jgi:hypothetical protein
MANPRGCLRVLTQTLMRLARSGDAEGIRGYLRTDEFLAGFVALDPRRRQTVMRCFGKAEALCQVKTAHPLVQPRTIDAKRAHKTDWSDPVMRTKLANAYARSGGDHEQAARTLGVSLGAARLAKKRHLEAATIGPARKPGSGPQAAVRHGSTPGADRLRTASVTGCEVAFVGRRRATTRCAPVGKEPTVAQ